MRNLLDLSFTSPNGIVEKKNGAQSLIAKRPPIGQKFLFFNAEAIYDSFWDCEESRGQDFTVHAFKLKKKYADCYTSDYPETMIETESPAICMNKFPSKTSDRVVYNIYNRAYSTFRGVVLKVPYREGATYYDAWNEKELSCKVVDGMAELYLEIGA